jgi:hypothetical protein
MSKIILLLLAVALSGCYACEGMGPHQQHYQQQR